MASNFVDDLNAKMDKNHAEVMAELKEIKARLPSTWISKEQLAEKMGVCKRTLDRYDHDHLLEFYKVKVGHHVMFNESKMGSGPYDLDTLRRRAKNDNGE